MSDATGTWNYPTAIRFGAGRIAELPDACAELGIARPLLVTDPGIAGLPICAQTLAILQAAGLQTRVFSEIRPNPTGDDVDRGVRAFAGAGCDGVVAFGGGAALDVGKAVALMVGQQRPLWDFEDRDDWYTRVDVAGMAPVVAVPTTSGTGSEVGRSSVILDPSAQVKRIIFHPRMLPARIIADPALTVGLPAPITAAVGMDALSHNLEAYCAPGFHPMADGIAVEGIRRVHRSLADAYANGADLSARADMMAASTMGATAFQKGLGAMHAMSHPIGAVFDTHHGLTNAVVMPYVLAFNRPAIDAKLTALARYLDLPNPSFDAFFDWVMELRATMEIPHTLVELGIDADRAVALAPLAVADPTAPTNPLPLDVAAMEHLYRCAATGEVP